MDDLKQAYEKLGLPEDATREQVEQRYFLLLKKARAQHTDLDDITQAYKTIVGFESEKASPAEKQGKLAYFFYYYKIHVIVALIVVIVAVMTVKGIVDRRNEEANKPPLDLSVTVYGNFFSIESTEPNLSKNMLALVPEWKRIDVGMSYVPREVASQQDIAMQQKAMLLLMTEKSDLMILDELNFDQLAAQDAFVPLDTLSLWPEWEKNPSAIRSAVLKDSGEKHPYGIEITESGIFKGTSMEPSTERKFLAMRVEPEHRDQALKMMQLLTLP